MKTYRGTCHCGAISFAFEHEEIKSGLRCNCSICRRKGAIMSNFTIQPDKFDIEAKGGVLGLYQFDTKIAKHYFCKTCGIYPFHETMRKPGHYRVNLGCIDEIDTNAISVDIFDGKSI
ncbi:MAG: GFA family protein [Gammaproteobacteria bacterium]|nr:GFA family protein [Gammaproteobacteria bacterium]